MRKRSRPQPIRFVNNAHQASSSAAVCDSSSSSLCCFPFFYLLLITWIFLSTYNPTLSDHPGGDSWSVPWFNGVQADGNNGEQKLEINGSFSATQIEPVAVNEDNPSNHAQLAVKSKTCRSRSVQDLKCKSPLFKDVLSLSALSACHHSSSDACEKKNGGVRTSSNLPLEDSARRHVSLHANEGRDESQHFQDGSNEGSLQHEGKSNMHRDGVADESEQSRYDHIQEKGAHVHVDDEKEDQAKQQDENSSERRMQDHDKDGKKHYNPGNVEIDTQHQAPTPLPGAGVTSNETGSEMPTADILSKIRPALSNLTKAHLRQEPGDGLYNYAADSKGAKILASNKEAKGASNILNKDKDKYFRTPCNVETKFVDMELSEETLVVQIVIANHEFYSSNVREFEIWGSSTYPSEEWVSLGKFEAENLRVPQLFSLKEPHWVRYLKLQMIRHYGSDFYCTLSTVEVYGVDAIESFLEDWIAEEAGGPHTQTPPSQEKNSSTGNKGGSPMPSQSHSPEKDADSENELDLMFFQKLENTPTEKGGDVSEGKGKNVEKPQPSHHQTGRPALDSVMKLLMQKVRNLEHKEPLFAQQLKDLDEKYKEASRAHSKEQLMLTSKLEEAATEIARVNTMLHAMESKWSEERLSLQKDVLNQMKAWNTDLDFLRSELSRTENKELVALAVSFFSTITVAAIHVVMLCASAFKPGKQTEISLLLRSRTLWAVPFLGCILVIFVLSL